MSGDPRAISVARPGVPCRKGKAMRLEDWDEDAEDTVGVVWGTLAPLLGGLP